MAKSLDPNMQAHLDSGAMTLVMCWKITPRAPGTVTGFTEHLTDIDFAGLTYKARSGFSPTAIRQSSDLAVDNFDVDFLLDFDGTEEADLIGGLYDFADIEVFLVNYNDLTMGSIPMIRGTIGEITINRGQANAEIRGLAQALQQGVLEQYSPTCRADLGDSECKVNLAAFTVTGSLTSLTSNKQFADSSRTEANDHFNGGLLTWTSGNNNQLKMEVKDFNGANGEFTLYQAMPKPIQVGDTYSVYRGCDKTLATCKNIFNNVVNFRGEPHVPGRDQILQFGGQR